jgi:hypothetical protein
MNNKSSRLEFLPNEILIVVFQYFDGRDLFRTFFNLNTRLNDLLRSLNHLSLTISKSNHTLNDNDNIFIPYIHNLIIQDEINIDLTRFTNIDCLILMHATYEQMKQLDNDILPYLKHVSILNMHLSVSTELSYIFNKIFSNHFSHLQSCSLLNRTIIIRTQEWIEMPSLRILEVGLINLFAYEAILSLCPNLYSFKFIIFIETEIPSHIKSHLNIKRLILKNDYFAQSWDNRLIEIYLSCVPNLEQLCMYRHIFSSNMKNCLMNCDWCASLIGSYLPLLRRFNFHLHVVELENVDIDSIARQLVQNFQSSHNGRYQSGFVIGRSQMRNFLQLQAPM